MNFAAFQQHSFLKGLLVISGAGLVGFAITVSDRTLEEALLGSYSQKLSWGPTLFRSLSAFHGLALVICGFYLRKLVEPTRPNPTPSSDPGSELSRPRVYISLVILSIFAMALRLWHLNSDLWYDELISLLDFFRAPVGEIVTSFPSQNQHMLYSILAHSSIVLFGESAASVRLPSVLFGVGSIWALFLLGHKIVGTRETLIACGLMTFSYHHVWFSQNARGYMGLLFFTLLATWLILEAFTHDTWKLWLGYAIAVSLGHWLHMTMVFVVIAHALLYAAWLLFPNVFRTLKPISTNSMPPGFSWKAVVSGILVATLTLQLHALALPEFLRSALHMESKPAEWSSTAWVIIESLRSFHLGPGLIIGLGGLLLVGAGLISMMWRNLLVALMMILPAFLGGVTMLALEHYLWPRFFFFSMGFGVLIVVQGAIVFPHLVVSLWNRRKTRHGSSGLGDNTPIESIGLSLAGLLIVASILTLPKLYSLPKQDFTGARNWVERTRNADEPVVAVGLASVAYGRYFAPQWEIAKTMAEFNDIRSKHSNLWLVYTIPIQMKAYYPEIWNAIEREFETVEVFPGTLGGGGIYVCRQRMNAVHFSDISSTAHVASH